MGYRHEQAAGSGKANPADPKRWVETDAWTFGHRAFTFYLIAGKGDLDTDGMTTVDEIYTYVSKKFPEVTGQRQNPVKKGEVEGQLIRGRVR